VVLVAAAAAGAASPLGACGLEATINGGFTVSHPRSLDVAVAVANARRDGRLPPASASSPSNDVLLRLMIADIRHMQSRLRDGRSALAKGSAAPFSLVLVGPGLWSHFHLTSGGVLARYHVDGPLEGKVVVLTHHAVLKALLEGTLGPEQAAEQGLLVFTGGNTEPVQQVFRQGFRPNA
jgi:hypothetical protein